jgi:hypothetical protein
LSNPTREDLDDVEVRGDLEDSDSWLDGEGDNVEPNESDDALIDSSST